MTSCNVVSTGELLRILAINKVCKYNKKYCMQEADWLAVYTTR